MGIAVIKGAVFALGSDCDLVFYTAILERLDVRLMSGNFSGGLQTVIRYEWFHPGFGGLCTCGLSHLMLSL